MPGNWQNLSDLRKAGLNRVNPSFCQDGEQGGKRPEGGLSLASWDETGALVLGHLQLRGKWLVLEVNSAARAERGKQMLMQLLSGLVATPITETQSMESALEEHRARKRSSAEEAAPKLPPEEAARVMRELLDRHYRRVIAEPLPRARGANSACWKSGADPHREFCVLSLRPESNRQTVEKLEGYRRDHEQIDRRDL
jgi:hypothetical protein